MNYQPSAIDVEDIVLGAILIDKKCREKALSLLKTEYFYSPENEKIFEGMKKLSTENKPIDIVTVLSEIGSQHSAKVMQVTSRVSSGANIEYHIAILVQKYSAREILRECDNAVKKVYEDDKNVFDIRSSLLSSLESLSLGTKKEAVTIKETVKETIKTIKSIQGTDKKVLGIDSKYRDINKVIHGWQSPDLIIIAARPSTGKTAFALNIAANVARQNIGVLFFSLEMSARQLSERLMADETDVYLNYIRTAELNETHWKFIESKKFDYPLFIDDSFGLSIYEFKEKAREMKRKYDIKMIVVDYLQLMKGEGNKNRDIEIGSITRTLKGTAKELDIPIIALAQLSRDVEKRKGSPILSDLRESGNIEQDADIVGFLHNPNPQFEVNVLGQSIENPEPVIEFIIAKHRNGEVKTLEFRFDKGHQRFKDI